jgi:heat shock protein HtpX
MLNQLKTLLLLGLLTTLLVWMGGAFGGRQGAVLAFGLTALFNVGAFWFSDRVVLRMYNAQPVGEGTAIHRLVARLAQRAGLPMPRVYLIPQDAPNAFATGRSPAHAAVAVTEGLVRLMDEREVEAVVAHELGHIAHRDTLISTIAAVMAGAVAMLADFARWSMIFGGSRDERDEGGGGLLALLFAPVAALLVQLAISRSREYAADAFSARLLGTGVPLQRSLLKLEQAAHHIPADATPATAHLFIVNPFSARGLMALFRTHPLTEDRVEALRRLESAVGTVRTGFARAE